MNSVRERILLGIKRYEDYEKHKDLISFSVCSSYFEDYEEMEENGGCEVADFSELIVVVEKEWLFSHMLKEGIFDQLYFLQAEYTSDNSFEWFEAAKEAGKIVVVSFH